MVRKFRRNEDGTIAVLFALIFIPVILMVGLAMDGLRIFKLKETMQGAIDAAALAGAITLRDRQGDTTEAVTRAEAFFTHDTAEMNTTRFLPWGIEREFKADTDAARMTGTAKAKLPMTFMAILTPHVWVEVATTAQIEGRKLDLAVMLDVTGSMEERSSKGDLTTRMEDLKGAMKDLTGIFAQAMMAKKARIGLAPFSEAVFVGNKADLLRGKVPATLKIKGDTYRLTQCVSERMTNRTSDMFGQLGPVYTSNGNCAPDRGPIALTHDRDVIDAAVQNLKTGGTTAGHLGIAWASYLLSPSWADYWGAEIKSYDDTGTIKAAILMTDGEFNTQYCDGLNDNERGACSGQASATQARNLCAAMRDRKIRVYTIGFDVNSTARQMLSDCAPGRYFEAFDKQSLSMAFLTIGKELAAQVHLVH